MAKIKIEGGKKLTGIVNISGAKNSAVALIPAAILCDEETTITNVPNISDVDNLEMILKTLNVGVERNGNTVKIDCHKMKNAAINEKLSSKLRASYYFMGALLGKYHKVDMHFPGGCSIGKRPIDLHLKGFRELGANVIEEDDHIIIEAEKLIGNKIYLDIPSVGATINIMLASVKAEGTTIIENAAQEPEIVNVAMYLNNMGANITGAGTNEIRIIGVDYLSNAIHEVIPDRIEAGTYLIIASLLGNDMTISRIIPNHLDSLISKLQEAGVKMEIGSDYIRINKVREYKSIKIKTLVYPGFPTDLQQPLIPFLTQCKGTSKVEETIYENRFQNITDTIKMGANIKVDNNRIATIKGITPLEGKEVSATDLRGGASMLICGLIANGITIIDNINYILRGYDDIIGKLKELGANIELID